MPITCASSGMASPRSPSVALSRQLLFVVVAHDTAHARQRRRRPPQESIADDRAAACGDARRRSGLRVSEAPSRAPRSFRGRAGIPVPRAASSSRSRPSARPSVTARRQGAGNALRYVARLDRLAESVSITASADSRSSVYRFRRTSSATTREQLARVHRFCEEVVRASLRPRTSLSRGVAERRD